ncbi:hypothetical protein [Enterococcus hirae]|uniref:hypothetical protein n=1 Tax=Enterococcus hirae TaxID=1354 RepID=UPI001368E6D9|nr:hypothetical protein [Enterococcus hirae]NAE18052.1 hypothetical protein [Enterococcus hirae]
MSPIAPPAPFADLQRTLQYLLQDGLAGLPPEHAGGVRPTTESLRLTLPFVLAFRFGGSNDGITDTATIQVEVYASRYDQGAPLAQAAQSLICAAPHVVTVPVTDDVGAATTKVLIDNAEVINAPVEMEFADENVRRWVATYRVQARRPVVR